jgi:hypothetical protein
MCHFKTFMHIVMLIVDKFHQERTASLTVTAQSWPKYGIRNGELSTGSTLHLWNGIAFISEIPMAIPYFQPCPNQW